MRIGSRAGLLMLLSLGAFMFAVGGARAFTIQELPEELGSALGVSATMAGIILSCSILLSAAIALNVSGKNNIILTIGVLLGLVGMLTALNWLDPWLLILLGMVIALMVGGKMRDWAASRSGE